MSKKRLLLNFLALSCLINNGVNAKESLNPPPQVSGVSKSNSTNSASNVTKTDENKSTVENTQNKVGGFFDRDKILTKQVAAASVAAGGFGLGGGAILGYFLGSNGKTDMNDKITKLSNEISNKNSEINTKNAKISQLESEVDTLKKSGGDDTQKLKDEIQNLKNKISQKEQEIINLNGNISSNSEIITNMTNTIKQKEKEVEDAKLALAGGNEAIQKIIKETQAKATSLENANLLLNKQLIETNKKFEALTSTKNVLANENKKQKEDLEKLKKENEELRNKGKENDNAEVKIYKAVYYKLNKLLDKYGVKLGDYSNDKNNLKSLFIDIEKYIAFGTTLTDLLKKGKCYNEGKSYKRRVAPLCILAFNKDLREEDRNELDNIFLAEDFSINALNQFLAFTPKVNGDGKQPDWKKAYDKNVEGMIGLGVRLSRKLADMVDDDRLYKKNGILDYELTERALPQIKLTRKSKE